MCTYVCPVLLLAVVVIYPTTVVCQCTTSHCQAKDDGDDVNVLTAMVSRLQDTVELLQQQRGTTTFCIDSDVFYSVSKRWFPPRDCYDLLRDGNNVSGVYEVYLVKARKFVRVFCNMDSDNGGWMVFQRRQDGSVDFYRDWADYKEGFGDIAGEFWLGNDYLNDITSQAQYVLRIEMEDFMNETRQAVYSHFAVASESNKYKLTLGTYSGNAAGHSFSTKNRDNDAYSDHCSQMFKAGWWYNQCFRANLNGLYLRGRHTVYGEGIEWHPWHGYFYSLKKVTMKLRP
ncbi:hypothetical protein NP493_351g01015 [Ridgeia piscesae]|uniref:Fibrinogen C-terminal domain-containing protein n=1 Tax=Ridgeia piscesae TaxID=27915 RepID=A0AAD9L4G9_RIDPI|nr:hypothetical protein NP493_351g01015 [Ridgeia piscesae]